MSTIQFNGSDYYTIGIEIELQTVDPLSKKLISGAPAVLDYFHDDPHVKQELLQSVIEIDTGICETVRDAERDLVHQLAKLIQFGDENDISYISAGTHPFALWREQKLTDNERYYRQVERLRWNAMRLLTFGLHIHIGVPSGEKAIAFLNASSMYLPFFLALSASSPFWVGIETGLSSARSKIFESLPGGGLPYRLKNWSEFQRMIRVLQKSQTIESIKEVWWDLRPHTTYGTIELRVCDAMPNLWETLSLAAFFQCLIAWFDERYERGLTLDYPRYWIMEENKWRAARYGTRSRLIVNNDGHQQSLRVYLEDLIQMLEPIAERLHCAEYLKRIESMMNYGVSADRQKRVYKYTNSLKKVVSLMEKELRDSCPEPKHPFLWDISH